MGSREFIKMHGLGNDFVVFDARAEPFRLDRSARRAIADRHMGVGCDQLISIEAPRDPRAQAFMRIHNADGGEVGACGNGTRCVARLLFAELGRETVTIETAAGLLQAVAVPDGQITVDMGPARTDWREIPLARPADTEQLPVSLGPLARPVGVNIGNPHAVFVVDDAEDVDLETFGPKLERHELFPERANIGIAHLAGPDSLRLRVWERGVGITRACGTGACAAVVAAARRGLTGRQAVVRLDGGELAVAWLPNGHVTMTGPADISFTGRLAGALAG
ncbi:MAG: diaminopimelate epimerase [Alphaproteobacteria bacterium]